MNKNEKNFLPQKLTACWCLRIRRVKKLIRTTPFGLSLVELKKFKLTIK